MPVSAGHGAGRITEDPRAILQVRVGWQPATCQPVVEQLGRARPMIPHGDRRDRAESRGVEDEKLAGVQREHDVMAVLILRDDLRDLTRRRGAASPGKDVRQGEETGELEGHLAGDFRWDAPDGSEGYFAHVEIFGPHRAKVSKRMPNA